LSLPLFVLLAVPLWAVDRMFGGNTLIGAVGCDPTDPLPIITYVPLLGMPLMVTNKNAGPGWKRLGLGGSCAVWRMSVPLESTVYVLFSCIIRWPMFIACVEKPGRISQTNVLVAASLPGPE